MTMSPLYPCGKLCSTGTHNETVKNLVLFSTFDRSNQERTTASALVIGQSSVTPQKENAIKTTLSRHLINGTWFKSEKGSSLYLVSAK